MDQLTLLLFMIINITFLVFVGVVEHNKLGKRFPKILSLLVVAIILTIPYLLQVDMRAGVGVVILYLVTKYDPAVKVLFK